MASVPTVKIDAPGGFCIINESDFDPKQHKLFSEKKEPVKAETKPAAKSTRKTSK